MCTGVELAVASLITTVVGAGVSVQQQRSAAQDQRKARRAEQRMASLQNAKERQKALAQERQLRARAEAQAVSSGISESSSAIGAVGSLRANTASNIGFQNTLNQLENSRLQSLDSAGRAATNAGIAGAVANVPTQLGFDPKSSFRELLNQG